MCRSETFPWPRLEECPPPSSSPVRISPDTNNRSVHVRVKTGGSGLKDLCSHLEVHWLERTSRLVYVQLSFFKTLPV